MKRQKIIHVAIFFLIYIVISSSKYQAINNDDILPNNEKNRINISKISSKISIIGKSGWQNLKNDGNCTGQGILSDPYIIEDLFIDAEGSGSCIYIENSDVYFKIQNCTIYNSGSSLYDSGIRLQNITNGFLLSNNCSNNKNGIYVSDNSHDNLIFNNTCIDTSFSGINLRDVYNNTITKNQIRGIILDNCDDNIISNNTLIVSLFLVQSDNNTIFNNTLINCGFVFSSEAKNNNFTRNCIIRGGFSYDVSDASQDCPQYIDTTNMVNGKPVNYYYNENNLGTENFTNAGQIILLNCEDSEISNLNFLNIDYGVQLLRCNNISVHHLNLSRNNDGLFLYKTNHTKVFKINSSENHRGIHIIKSTNNSINNNILNDNNVSGIYVYNKCTYINISHNSIKNNTYSNIEIDVKCKFNMISNNKIYNTGQWGIYIHESCLNHTVLNNTIKFCKTGICDNGGENHIIINNTLIGNAIGIHLLWGNNYTVLGNYIYNRYYNSLEANGIWLGAMWSDNGFSIMKNNTVMNCSNSGIVLGVAKNVIIKKNLIKSNHKDGIFLQWTDNNNFTENYIYNNTQNGIFFYNRNNNNTVTRNLFSLNGENSVKIRNDNNEMNLFYNNSFPSGLKIFDEELDNTKWNNSFIGNYWEDYSGTDANDDGIGDTPNLVNGPNLNYDYKPIFFDGPDIIINNPSDNQPFGDDLTPPSYNIEANNLYLDTLWYTLNLESKKYIINDNGTIDPDAWASLDDGTIMIRFYGNDTSGITKYTQRNIKKDTQPPNIMIISPWNEQEVGMEAPEFDINVVDVTLDTKWYMINGTGVNVTILGDKGILNQTLWTLAWNKVSNGENITIFFYANDTFGRISIVEITVKKDNLLEIRWDDSLSDPKKFISGFNLFIVISTICVLPSLVVITNKKLKNFYK